MSISQYPFNEEPPRRTILVGKKQGGKLKAELIRLSQVAERKRQHNYNPTVDDNPDPRCICIHPEADHDSKTGFCLNVNPTFGPCPCSERLRPVLNENAAVMREITPPIQTNEERGQGNSLNARLHRLIGGRI